MDMGPPSRAGLCHFLAPTLSKRSIHPPTQSCLAVPLWLYLQGLTNRLPCSPHSSGGRSSSPCTVMCGARLCFIGKGAQQGRGLEAEGKGRQSHSHP